jgi:hypothetical protein
MQTNNNFKPKHKAIAIPALLIRKTRAKDPVIHLCC